MQQSLARQHRQYAAMRAGVALVMTEQCPVGCSHCLASCTMHAPDLPPPETHLDWIAKVSRVPQCRSVSITGGEPFVHFSRLLMVAGACRAHGLVATVFTSAYWATSDEIAADRLGQLADAGLTGITVSADDYHQAHIPLARVASALRAAKACALVPKVAITCPPGDRAPALLERDLMRALGPCTLDGVEVEVGGVVRLGRARALVFPHTRGSLQPRLVCNALGPTIQRDGSVASCCRAPLPRRSPLVLGDLNGEEWAPVYQRFLDHPVIPFIQAWGLIEMLERLLDEGLATGLDGYRSAGEGEICELCQAILSEPAHGLFFEALFHDPGVRRRLAILLFLLYGDPALLEAVDG